MINLYSELDEVSFIAGSRQVLEFNIIEQDGSPAALSTMRSITWKLSYLGDKDNCVLMKNGVVSDIGCFSVTLETEDTINLRGKFVHQPILEDSSGHIYRPAEGLIHIVESIKE